MECKLSAEDGVDLLLKIPTALERETLPLLSALGRVLAETVTARMPVPPFARSPYDGYAIRSTDTASASPEHPVILQITEELPAGTVSALPVAAGTAAKILTGAPVPAGADTIVKYEDTCFTAETVSILHPCRPGNIVSMGEDVPAGTLLAKAGTLVTGPVMGLLAAQGLAAVRVFRRPTVSVISTGAELTSPGAPLPAGKIYGANLHLLGGLLRSLGANVLDGGTVADDPQAISHRLVREMDRADLVITTGGASVGDYDYTASAFALSGSELLFKRLAFRPGGAMMAGVRDGKMLLGLSGNPGAAAAGLLRVAAPYIRKLCGRNDLFWETLQVYLKHPLQKASPITRLLRGRLSVEGGTAFFEENSSRGSGSISSLLQCDLLAEIPAGSPPLEAGTLIKAYRVTV